MYSDETEEEELEAEYDRLSPSEKRAAECPRLGCIFCRGLMGQNHSGSVKEVSLRFIAEMNDPSLAEERRNSEVWPLLGPPPSYQDHIKSAWWFHVRAFVIRDAEEMFGCADCGIIQSAIWEKYGKGYQVHHLTYARMGNEHPEDLVALCPKCHTKRHREVIER